MYRHLYFMYFFKRFLTNHKKKLLSYFAIHNCLVSFGVLSDTLLEKERTVVKLLRCVRKQ